MGTEKQSNEFSVIEPAGTVQLTDRPTFRWSQMKEATAYVVEVYDSKFRSDGYGETEQRVFRDRARRNGAADRPAGFPLVANEGGDRLRRRGVRQQVQIGWVRRNRATSFP